MSERIPVNPDMLRWARETGGFDIDDVVVKLKRKRITFETVASWEKARPARHMFNWNGLLMKFISGLWHYSFFLNRLKKKLLKSLFGHYLKKKLIF